MENEIPNPEEKTPAPGPVDAPGEPEQDAKIQPAPEASPEAEIEDEESGSVEELQTPDRTEALEAQLADVNDKLLRAMAETENVRRRAQRDKEDASKYAIKSFAEQMITVSDNLSRALQSVDADARANTPALENIVVGIEMVERSLQSGFERAGIKPISALGQKFDPMKHEAMFELEDKNAAQGTIAQVLEVGYTLNDRTLRAAKVGITKGGPKSAPAAAPVDDAPADTQSKDSQEAYEDKGAEPGSQINEEL